MCVYTYTLSILKLSPLYTYLKNPLQARVVKSTERTSGALFALKIARVSLRIARTILRHEARVLQHLQAQAQAQVLGHCAVPKVFGYGREHHFEYLAMELLGPCLWEKIGEETRAVLQLETVVRLGQQLVRLRTTY